MDRVLVLAGVAALLVALVLGGRMLADRRRLALRRKPQQELWSALGTQPDGRATIVAFSTPSCAACWSAQKPALAALLSRAPDLVRVIHIDAAEHPEVAHAFGVLTVPATVVLAGSGAVLAANQGFATEQRLADQAGLADPHLGLPVSPGAGKR